MGRPKSDHSVYLQELFIFRQNEIFSNGQIVPPSHKVWTLLKNDLTRKSYTITEKAIYSAALRWHNSTKNVVLPQAEPVNEFEISVNSTSSNSLNSSDDASKNSQVLKCTIKLEHSVWKTIEPTEATYLRKDTLKGVRKYAVLQPGVWSNVIADAIAKQLLTPCTWAFKTNKCYTDRITFSAKCTTCSSNLFGSIDQFASEKQQVKINIEIHGMNTRRHEIRSKNVKIVGRRADEIATSGTNEFKSLKSSISDN